jgi:tight adherence protein C
MPVGSLVLFILCGCSLLAAVAGLRMLEMDVVLRERIEGQALVGAGIGASRRRRVHLPRWLLARGQDLDEIEKGLRSAGYFQPRAVETFVWMRLGAALSVALLSMLVCWVVNGGPLTPWWPTLALFGLTWIGAKLALKMRVSAREHVLTVEFPFLLDLMLMMLESGISLDQTFRGIARDERAAVPNHGRLVALLVDDIDRGMDYQIAFDRWAARVNVNGARELAALFRSRAWNWCPRCVSSPASSPSAG